MHYEIANDYKEVALKIMSKYPNAFSEFDVEKILFLKETDKKPKKYADVRVVRPPYSFITEHKFIITFYEQLMSELNEAQKNLVVYHELLHISPEFEKLVQHNVQDFAVIVAQFGPTWVNNPELKNILED